MCRNFWHILSQSCVYGLLLNMASVAVQYDNTRLENMPSHSGEFSLLGVSRFCSVALQCPG